VTERRPLITPAVLAVLARAALPGGMGAIPGTALQAERGNVRGMERVAALQMAGLARVVGHPAVGHRLIATAPGRKLLEARQ